MTLFLPNPPHYVQLFCFLSSTYLMLWVPWKMSWQWVVSSSRGKHNANCHAHISLRFYSRDKLAFTQSRAASYFFDGSSYAVVRDITRRGKFGQVTRFDIEVRTPADNGLVLLMVNGVSKYKSPLSSLLFPLLSTVHIPRNLPRLSVSCHQIEILV